MNRDIKTYVFDGKVITFENKLGTKFVSATQMAAAFDKRLNDFFRLKQTIEYINELHLALEGDTAKVPELKSASRLNIESVARAYPHLVQTVKGGTPELQGTWIHERLSLKLAAWLSPKFEIWVYDTIMELMKEGSVFLQGKERNTFEFYLNKITSDIDNVRILLDHIPGQLKQNIRVNLSEEE